MDDLGEDPLGKGMATQCSILVGRIPWAEEPGGLQSRESQRGGHDIAINRSVFLMDKLSPKQLGLLVTF